MSVTTCRLDGPVEFLSIGQFVSGPGWRHTRRIIDSSELMFVRRGTLPIRVGEREMRVGAGEVILLPRGVEHAGTEIITDDLEFYWLHFRLPDARVIAASSAADLPQDDRTLILPDRDRIPDPDRVAVLCGQLIDVYARFGPHRNAYCDYLATSLLLEISVQERASMTMALNPSAYMIGGIIGIRADGRPILAAESGGVGHDAAPDGAADGPDDANDAVGCGSGSRSGGDEPSDTSARRIGLAPMLAVRAWIMANACDDITVAAVAARFHYSPSYLTVMYKRVFGVGVAEQITEYRIDRARDLLSTTASPIANIAHDVGYDDPKYFMRVFKRRTGLTPGQYRDAFPKRLYNSV
ncbi:AraC family transcriptional regulator [Bifidobacterium aerophilum]|uniref:Helix-turn-helix domain-containing protein n=1 Tax=Bifidobacterium aerophilum TaxID=1798155 RepID=A0A6N9Z3R5_9BIFI|nr:AraC family transcriptional regulator [Bifidobacterium aerophilum]NEG88833.1 helix-turn-helix domain-containing protein [Bifidobacterium aerophilum]